VNERTSARRALIIVVVATLLGLGVIAFGLFRLASWLQPETRGSVARQAPRTEVEPQPALDAVRRSRLFAAAGGTVEDEPSALPAEHPFARIRVSGRVFDAMDGTPISGATVRVRPRFEEPRLGPPEGDGSAAFVSRGDGTFAMKGIPPGNFDVEVGAAGYVLGRFGFKKYSALEDDDGFDFGLLPSATVSGRVLSSGGSAVAGARIAAVGPDGIIGDSAHGTSSDDDGRFLLEGIDRDASLLVTHPRFAPAVVPSIAGGAERVVTLNAGLEVSGTVRGENGPIAGARIEPGEVVQGLRAAGSGGVESDRDGRFVLHTELGWRVALRASAVGYRTTEIRVDAAPGHAPSADFVLERAQSFNGRVLTAEGAPAAHARIVVSSDRWGSTAMGETDSTGRFSVSGVSRAGPYHVFIAHHAYPPMSVQEGALEGAHEYRLEPESRILGRVFDPRTGTPVTRYQYQLRGPLRSQSGAVSVSGALEIDQLAAGTYSLTVRSDGYQPSSIDGIVVSRGEATKTIDVAMRPGGRIEGRVSGTWDGELLVYAFRDNGVFAGGAAVDSDGAFTLGDLSEGTYVVRAEGGGMQGESGQFRVEPGAAFTGVSITLAHAPVVPEP
jgi:hypothetical protein